MDNSCIRNLLRLILLLQKNSVSNNCLDFGCSRSYLGPLFNFICYNTRVITLYRKDGSLLTVPYSNSESSYFRVNDINDNCVTLLILRRDNDNFYSTRETIIVNINCICAVKCISDVSIDCI